MKLYSDIQLEKLPHFIDSELENILTKEGEWSDDENDHPTKWGIIQATANACGYEGDLKDLSKHDAKRCWAIHSWYGPRYDLIYQVSPEVCKHVMDTSGPAGVSLANKHLQRLLNVLNDPVGPNPGEFRYGPDLTADGLIGAKTAERLKAYLDHRGKEGESVFIVAINAMQLSHYVLVAEKNSGKRDFSYGWWKNRVFNDLNQVFNAIQIT